MINKLLYVLFFFTGLSAFSQERREIHGKVIAGDNGVEDVFVINNTLGTEVKSESKGLFVLFAKPGDKITVYNTRIIVREFIVTEDAFKTKPFVITVNFKSYELDEVVINAYSHINAEGLGLVPKGQKRYTPVERKLKTAGDFKPIHLLALLGGSMELDPILNAISGRTKMLKKAVEIERKDMLLEKIKGIYTEKQIVDDFNIPADYINGFIYYCIEDASFVTATKDKNSMMAKFIMSELSGKYLELIKDEK